MARKTSTNTCPESGRTSAIEMEVKILKDEMVEMKKWRAWTEGTQAALGGVKTIALVFLGAGCTLLINLLLRAIK